MEEVENFELEQEVDGELPETQEVEYYDQDDMPSAVDDAADVMSSPTEDLIDQITGDDLVGAEGSFQSIIQDKLSDALDAKKVEIAGAVYNGIDIEDPSMESETEIEDAGEENSTETTDTIDEIEEN
tara:strand:- start:3173 stop:3553 length:381 start_codon:yes stop_codon:yes gene_type:complete